MNEIYIQKRQNRQKLFFRLRFGVSQMIHKPWLNILLFPIIAGTIYLWMKKDAIYTLFDVPYFMQSMYHYTILMLLIVLPVVCVFAVVIGLANIFAQKDEADLLNAFTPQELRNGCPILMSKKRMCKWQVLSINFWQLISATFRQIKSSTFIYIPRIAPWEYFCAYLNGNSSSGFTPHKYGSTQNTGSSIRVSYCGSL